MGMDPDMAQKASNLLVEEVTICMESRPLNVQMPMDSIRGHVIYVPSVFQLVSFIIVDENLLLYIE